LSDSHPVVDFWTNLRSPAAAQAWRDTRLLRQSAEARGTSSSLVERNIEDVLRDMDEAGIDISVVSGLGGVEPLIPQHNYSIFQVLEWCSTRPSRLRAALSIEGLGSISYLCRLIEELSANPSFVAVRVISIFLREPINSPRLYPIYERCEALRVAVSINVGVPGPRTRLALQDPLLLDDILIDFPDLTVVAAHMGHPWEPLLIQFMRKYENLFLTNSAWLAKYLHPELVHYMNSSVGRSRVLFASDAPYISPQRALEAAKKVAIDEGALGGFLGENATTVLGLLPDGRLARCDS
jgi:predicted TIM-barrel fold metal-dependent hydrolase